MNTFIVTGHGWHVDVATLAEAREVVADELANFEDTQETVDLGITITEFDEWLRLVDCHDVDSIIQPREPLCSRGHEHDWNDDGNDSVHGGGVTYSRTCATCGLICFVDTWHDDGYGDVLSENWIEYILQ